MSVLLFSANAVLPIIFLTFLGYILRQRNFLTPSFLACGNKLVFYVCLPAMMFYNIYNISGLDAINWRLVIFAVLATSVIVILAIIVSTMFIKERSCRGVLIQCIYRSNFGIIGLPLALSLGGDQGAAVAAVISAFIVPMFNALAIIILSAYADHGAKKHTAKDTFISIFKNYQVITACVALIVLAIRSYIPRDASGELVFSIKNDLSFIYKTIEDINKATPFMSLIVLGGMLDFSALSSRLRYIIFGTVGRVFLAPLIGLTGAYIVSASGFLNCGPAEYAALIALFGSPVAFSSAIMAEEMGGDGDLARQLVLWTSVASAFSLFIIISLCRSLALL